MAAQSLPRMSFLLLLSAHQQNSSTTKDFFEHGLLTTLRLLVGILFYMFVGMFLSVWAFLFLLCPFVGKFLLQSVCLYFSFVCQFNLLASIPCSYHVMTWILIKNNFAFAILSGYEMSVGSFMVVIIFFFTEKQNDDA